MSSLRALQRAALLAVIFALVLSPATTQLCSAQSEAAFTQSLPAGSGGGRGLKNLGSWMKWFVSQHPPPEEDPPMAKDPPTPPPDRPAPAPTPRPEPSPPPTQPPPPTSLPPPTQSPTTCAGGGEFERVFRDDFDGAQVGEDWAMYDSPGNAGFGLRRPSAFSVADGKLVITAQMQDGALVSGGMSHKHAQLYGKYVARVRTDRDPSVATSGVILTWPESNVHPRDGENNIYETTQSDGTRNPFYSFIHKPFGAKTDQEYYEHFADGTQYQLLSMEWTPDRITITREGPGDAGDVDVWTVQETGEDLIPDNPHRMTVQLDAWEHQMGAPVRMEVDYVEVYKYCR